MTESQKAFESILAKHYPNLDSALRSKLADFRYVSLATESLWNSFEFGFKAGEAYGRKQALKEAVAICSTNATPTRKDVSQHVAGFEAGSAACMDEIMRLIK
jgi:hypothetical protein